MNRNLVQHKLKVGSKELHGQQLADALHIVSMQGVQNHVDGLVLGDHCVHSLLTDLKDQGGQKNVDRDLGFHADEDRLAATVLEHRQDLCCWGFFAGLQLCLPHFGGFSEVNHRWGIKNPAGG